MSVRVCMCIHNRIITFRVTRNVSVVCIRLIKLFGLTRVIKVVRDIGRNCRSLMH
jgi:hypothetical protein